VKIEKQRFGIKKTPGWLVNPLSIMPDALWYLTTN